MECKVCGKTTPSAFYSSIKTHCKDHWREKVRNNRLANIEHYKEFDRQRANNPERVAARKAYMQTEDGKKAAKRARAAYMQTEKGKTVLREAKKAYAKKNPAKRDAHVKLNNALRDGRVSRTPCLVCGCEKTEAHHVSYDLPLDVVWLCDRHHKQVHKEHRENERKKEAA